MESFKGKHGLSLICYTLTSGSHSGVSHHQEAVVTVACKDSVHTRFMLEIHASSHQRGKLFCRVKKNIYIIILLLSLYICCSLIHCLSFFFHFWKDTRMQETGFDVREAKLKDSLLLLPNMVIPVHFHLNDSPKAASSNYCSEPWVTVLCHNPPLPILNAEPQLGISQPSLTFNSLRSL